MIIDVHAHGFPADYFDFMGRFGRTGPLRADDMDFRLRMMDQAHVARQILSPTKSPYLEREPDGVHAACLVNDRLAAMRAMRPDRFGLWVSPPLPHIDASLREIERGFDQLGASGVTLQCFCMDLSIADSRFDPIYAELNSRDAIVFLHPCQNGLHSHFLNDWGLTVCAGASFEDSTAAMHLIARAVPQRFPRIRFIVPHFGGILPILLERLDGQMPRTDLPEPPSRTAKRFFYDSVGWGSKAALIAAVAAFGDTQIVPGSDWPILLDWESYAQTFDHIRCAGLPERSVERILHENAPLLLDSYGGRPA